VAVDAKDGFVATQGWLELSERRAGELGRELAELPLAALLYTDISRDGTEVGPNVAATAAVAREAGLPVIASGGVGTLAHLAALAAAGSGIVGAIVGRALHERRFSLEEALRAARGERAGS
jgi:phosphoribosylformimino-5-aminoimidazole carboxamide ribotide isomerase